MKQIQRFDHPGLALREALSDWQSKIWTALPGIVQTVRFSGSMTVDVQPAIQGRMYTPTNDSWSAVTLPLLIYCPILFPGGGGYLATFPIQAKDEVLVVFASRCIDAWWQSGGVQAQIDFRHHDLSDGFAIPKLYSVPNAPGNISTTTAQLRSFDGTVYAEIDKPNNRVHLRAPTQILLDAPTTTITGVVNVQNTNGVGVAGVINGQLQATQDIIASTAGNNISVTNHIHNFTDSRGDTGPTVAPTPNT